LNIASLDFLPFVSNFRLRLRAMPGRVELRVSGLLLTLLCILLASVHAQAQNMVMKNGQVVAGVNLRRSGASVLTQAAVAGVAGDVAYPVSSIAKIEFPEPPEITEATDLMVQGKTADALAKINPVVAAQAPFKDIPGNWWAQAAQIKLAALGATPGSEADSEMLISDMLNAADPEVVLYARLRQAVNLARKGNSKQAITVCDAVIKQSKRKATLAEAWYTKGSGLLQESQYDAAQLALLHIPVYYSDQKLLMPGALLKSSRAYSGNEDYANAKATLEELMKNYPGSVEAVQAKTELKKVENKSSIKQPPTNP